MRKYVSPALAFLISAGLGASAQTVRPLTTASVPVWTGAVSLSTGSADHAITLESYNPPPANALYHQVVDRYYDASGQEVEE